MTKQPDLKTGVRNYKQAIVASGVPEEYIFQPIAIELSEIQALIDSTSDIEGIRIYMSKDTSDPNNANDYKLLLVPCRKVNPQDQSQQTFSNENEPYLEDILDAGGLVPTFRLIADCKRPPGCTPAGALLW